MPGSRGPMLLDDTPMGHAGPPPAPAAPASLPPHHGCQPGTPDPFAPPRWTSLRDEDPRAPPAPPARRHSAAPNSFAWEPWRGRRGSEGQLKLLAMLEASKAAEAAAAGSLPRTAPSAPPLEDRSLPFPPSAGSFPLGTSGPLLAPPLFLAGTPSHDQFPASVPPLPPVLAPVPDPESAELYRAGRKRRRCFRDLRLLGAGSEGRVKEVIDTSTGTHYALKTIMKPPADRPEERKQFEQSMRARSSAMRALSHPHVVEHADGFESASKSYILTELAAGGDLRAYADRRGGTLAEDEALQVATILLSTLSFLHSKGVVHRDIKPTNVLLRRTDDLASLVLADFGSAWVRKPAGQQPELPSTGPPSDPAPQPAQPSAAPTPSQDGVMKTLAGTPFYLPPELVTGLPYTPKVDLWALGCMLYDLLFGRAPFADAGTFPELFSRICKADFTFPPGSGVSEQAKAFIRRLLDPDQATRPGADEALRVPWILGAGAGAAGYHGREESEGGWKWTGTVGARGTG